MSSNVLVVYARREPVSFTAALKGTAVALPVCNRVSRRSLECLQGGRLQAFSSARIVRL
jgi:hypothetical protein